MEAGDLAAGRQQHGREGGLRERVSGEKKKSTLRVWPVSKETQKREKRKVAPLGGQTQ